MRARLALSLLPLVNGPVGDTASLAQLRARLGRPLVEKGTGSHYET